MNKTKKKFAILCASQGNNYQLSKVISDYTLKYTIKDAKNTDINPFSSEIVDILKMNLTVFSSRSDYSQYMPDEIFVLGKTLKKSDGIVVVAPEYNGTAPPCLINAVAWLSVCSGLSKDFNWRSCFVKKPTFLATHSSAYGTKALMFMRYYFSHLGALVISREFSYVKPDNYKELHLGLHDLYELVLN